jgi:Na+-transporting methylmalonyl-CoA/oxaloacetate decarboxylase gamma subunit
MWTQAIRVAIVGFSVVFAGLWILAIGVKIMSFFCRLTEKKGSKPKEA